MKNALTVILSLIASVVLAHPAMRVKRMISLPDGTQVEAVLHGDEHVHFYQTKDGRVFLLDEEDIARPVDKESLLEAWNAKLQESNKMRTAKAAHRKTAWGDDRYPISGQKTGLVILVNYSDLQMQHTNADFVDYFNKKGYSVDNMAGSVHDYFYDQSYGKFDLTFDVVGPVTLNKSYRYYGENTSDMNHDDKHAGQMIAEACIKAEAMGVDFRKYDWDDDGVVDQVFVIYAGYSEAAGASSYTIWPHQFELSHSDYRKSLKYDGVTIDSYACTSELSNTRGNRLTGIGAPCHEFSHCLYIPDTYDVNSYNFGMSSWDLMDYGAYNGEYNCTVPCGYTSYERMYCGWLDPIVLEEGCKVEDMPALTSEPVAYLIRNEGHPNEFYMLENRQLEGWDKYGYGHGMLVIHVDYNAKNWFENRLNVESNHQRMTIIPADNSLSDDDLAGDPWPGSSNNTALTNTSSPAAKLYNTNADGSLFMNKPIENIVERDGKISFLFNGGPKILPPIAEEAKEVDKNSFTALWDAVEGAESYEVFLSLRPYDSSKGFLLLKEDFEEVKKASPDNAVTSGSCGLDGWTLSTTYASSSGLRIASAKNGGSAMLPVLETMSGDVTVVLEALAYGYYNPKATISCGADEQTFYPETNSKVFYFHFHTDGPSQLTISSMTKHRFFLSSIAVYDGWVSEDMVDKVKVIEPQTVSTEGTTFAFSNLDPDYYYLYKVRAKGPREMTEWSNTVRVDLDHSGVQNTKASSMREDALYDMFGRRLECRPKRGLYIENGKKRFYW